MRQCLADLREVIRLFGCRGNLAAAINGQIRDGSSRQSNHASCGARGISGWRFNL